MTRTEKALLIAKHEGNVVFFDAKETHGNFNLMKIVERVNTTLTNNNQVPTFIEISNLFVKVTVGNSIQTFAYTSQLPLINALQDAILFYHENKDKQ